MDLHKKVQNKDCPGNHRMRKSVKGSLKVAIKTVRTAETVSKALTNERTKHRVRAAKTRIYNSLGREAPS